MTNRYTYDALNRLTNLVAGTPSVSLASFAYKLAAAGNRTNQVETINSVNRTNQWQYDPLYRLTNEIITASSGGTISYKYDGVGNRTNRTSSVSGITNQTFTFNSNDQLSTDVYDSNGNTRTNTGNVFFYDAENRLTNAIVGGTSVTLVYDGDGNRVKKIVGTTTNTYLVDSRNPSGFAQVLEEKSNGVLSKVYCYGLDLVSQRDASSGTLYYFGHDGNGNTRFLTGANAGVSNVFAFDAFGSLIASNAAPQTDYLFAGEQRDGNLGLTYLRARYLNTGTGRFWSRDSFAGNQDDPMSLHRYLYCHDDPVNNIDPSGNEIMVMLAVLDIGGMLAQITNPTTSRARQATQRVVGKEGNPNNLAKRKKIDEIARKYNGSKLWNYDVKKDDFPPNSNKCNKFVYDVTKEAGAEALITVQGTKRPPLAAEYADTGTKLPNWRTLKSGENAEPGDIAAYKLSDGGTAYSGHTGFITKDGNISAHADGVYPKPDQFEKAEGTVYRRYTGE